MERKKERKSLERSLCALASCSGLPAPGGIDNSKYSCVESNTLCGLGTRASACPAGARPLPRSSHADFPRAPRGCPESGALTVSHTHLTLRPTSLSLWFPGRWIESNRLEDPSSAAASPSPAPLSWTGRPPTAAAAPCRHRSLPLMPRPAQSGGSSASPARPGLRGRGPPAA